MFKGVQRRERCLKIIKCESMYLMDGPKPYWEEESQKFQKVSQISKRLLIQNNCEFVRVPKRNEAVVQNRKILSYHKRLDRRLSNIQKSINFAISAILEIANESLKYEKETKSSFYHKKEAITAIDVICFMEKATYSTSGERRASLKSALNEEI